MNFASERAWLPVRIATLPPVGFLPPYHLGASPLQDHPVSRAVFRLWQLLQSGCKLSKQFGPLQVNPFCPSVKMLQGSAILLSAARPVPYKGSDSPAPARLCIDPGPAMHRPRLCTDLLPIFCHFKPLKSLQKAFPYKRYSPQPIEQNRANLMAYFCPQP